MDVGENVHGVLQQGVQDPISELHLHKQLVFIVVHPQSLFLMELLHLQHTHSLLLSIYCIDLSPSVRVCVRVYTRMWSTLSLFFRPNLSIFCQSVLWFCSLFRPYSFRTSPVTNACNLQKKTQKQNKIYAEPPHHTHTHTWTFERSLGSSILWM